VAVIGPTAPARPRCSATIAGACRCRLHRPFDGAPVAGRPAHELWIAASCSCPRGAGSSQPDRRENLLIGAYRGRPGRWTLARIFELFRTGRAPSQPARNHSGASSRCWRSAAGSWPTAPPAGGEISLGLAPLVIQVLYRVLRVIAAEGITTLVVEQARGHHRSRPAEHLEGRRLALRRRAVFVFSLMAIMLHRVPAPRGLIPLHAHPPLHREEAQVPAVGHHPPEPLRVGQHHSHREVPSRIMYQAP